MLEKYFVDVIYRPTTPYLICGAPGHTVDVKPASKPFYRETQNREVCKQLDISSHFQSLSKTGWRSRQHVSRAIFKDVYAMSKSPRGYAVVITMTKGRPGADVDDRNISESGGV